MIITTHAYPRAGLVGNPSDGYFGKTIAFTFTNFRAEVVLYQTPELEILPSARDHSRFSSIDQLAEDVSRFGYYGGIRLLKATIKKFHEYCRRNSIFLDNRNFTIRYKSDIPNQVGLAGSSAIITACMRALMAFYQIAIPAPVLANLVLSVETEELQIPAGLQDRVAQVYQGAVYMDFNKDHFNRYGYGRYEMFDTRLLPSLYIAYRVELSEGTEIFHNDIRGRFNRGESDVVEAMSYWAELTDQVYTALKEDNKEAIGPLLNANFDRRREIYRISKGNLEMVNTARATGASAKFSGSGGAIVGTCQSEEMFQQLKSRLEPLGIVVLKPKYAPPADLGPPAV